MDAMDGLMYDTLIRYFKTLAHTGYKSYDVVFKILVMDFIYEITHTELRYYITNKDIKLMQDLLYQFFGSTCEISFPTNNRPCCVCVCCNGEGSTPPPIVVPTTTTTTTPPPPKDSAYITLTSKVATTAYIDNTLVNLPYSVERPIGNTINLRATSISGYKFDGFVINGHLHNNNPYDFTSALAGTYNIELLYRKAGESTTTSTPIPGITTTTTTTTTSSTPAPTPAPATVTLLFKAVDTIAYTATYNRTSTVEVTNTDVKELITVSDGSLDVNYIINDLVSNNSAWRVSQVKVNGSVIELPYHGNIVLSDTDTIEPVFAPIYSSSTTTTTTTSSTPIPVVSNDETPTV